MNHCTYHVSDVVQFKAKMLGWVKQFNIFCFLDNCNYTIKPQRFQWLLGAGVQSELSANLHQLNQFVSTPGQWKFGHLSYELKNNLHSISASANNKIGFPDFYFFVPQIVVELSTDDELTIHADDPETIYQAIQNHNDITCEAATNSFTPKPRISEEAYIDCINRLQKHIARGDCYEINFCVEFFCDDVAIDPLTVFKKLQEISPNPFSAFYKWNDSYLLCASPERFLCRQNATLISQPIKGTIERNRHNAEKDEVLKKQLSLSKKDQAENVMVVDLVRNDLSRICKDDSVKVDELFGIYSFPQVHQ
ncbi:MAG: chorismate-binding protein, partial [Bacteroidota bacterium]